MHRSEPGTGRLTHREALDFFRGYRRALGRDVDAPGQYLPGHEEILSFAQGLAHLRRGDRAGAAAELQSLVHAAPAFVDAWLWLTATIDDPVQRRAWLGRAIQLDGDHPLAREALAVVQEQVPDQPGEAKEPEAPDEVEQAAAPTGKFQPGGDGPPWQEARQMVRCQACGAGLTALDHAIRRCVFCSAEEMRPQAGSREWQRPGQVLPFRISAREAILAISWESRLSLTGLKGLWTGQVEKLVELEAVYLPFWSFDGSVEAYRMATTLGRPGKESLRWDSYEQVLIPAVAVPAQALLAAILPFDLAGLVPYDPEFLASQPARIPDREAAQAAEAARSTMLAQSRSHLPGRRRKGRDTPAWQVQSLTCQLVLLPVWLGRLASTAEQRRVMVNGWSGRVAFGPSLANG
jgi:hypothetical protein